MAQWVITLVQTLGIEFKPQNRHKNLEGWLWGREGRGSLELTASLDPGSVQTQYSLGQGMIEHSIAILHITLQAWLCASSFILSHSSYSLCSHLYNKATSLSRDEIPNAESDSRQLAEETQSGHHCILALANWSSFFDEFGPFCKVLLCKVHSTGSFTSQVFPCCLFFVFLKIFIKQQSQGRSDEVLDVCGLFLGSISCLTSNHTKQSSMA